MADGNVIDSLSIEISANADKAAKGLDQLSARLRSLSASVKNLSGAAQTLNVLSNSFQRLGSVNVGNISKAIDQLERLSRLDLKDKQIKMEVTLTGASEAERQMHAVQHAMSKIDPAEFSRKLAKAFQIDDKNAIANLEKEFRHILTSYSSGDLQINNSELFEPIIQNGHVMKSEFDSDIRSMQSRYKEFLDYVNSSKFHVASDTWKSVAKTYAGDNEIANKGALSIFTTQKAARDLNGMWEQLTDYTDGYGDVFDRLLSDTKEGFMQMAKYITADTQQMEALIEVVQKAREALGSIPVKELDQGQRTQALKGTVTQGVKDMLSAYNAEVNQYMKDSTNKVPIDVIVDATTIEKRIDQAIKQAAEKEYKLPLQFSIPTKDIKSQLTNILSGLKLNDIQNVAVPIQDMSRALYDLGNINIRDNGTGAFINNIRKLSEVKIDPSTPTHIASIANSLGGFAKIGNISSNITRFISALARLASAGKSIQDVTTELPNFATAIQKVATTLSQLGGVSPELVQFISAMGQLANVGKKMPEAAQNMDAFGDAVRRMVQSIGGQNVNADVAQLVTALSQLSASMAQAGRNFSGSGGGGKSGASSFNSGFTLFKKILNEITKLANKAAHLIIVAFRKIGQGIATIVKGAVAKLEELKKSIMSLASSVASSAFGKIKSGLSGILNISEIQNATHSMYSLSDSIKVVIGSLLGMRGITGIFSWMKDAVSAGGDITEINHIIESVFEEDMVGYVNAWADNAIEKFGIASGAAKQYAGVLSSMFQSSGISKSDAGKMGMRLTELAGDLSAFYNIDTETAYQKLKSGMAGMVRPLRDLGIDLSVATLQEYALTQGITKSVTAMTQAEKVMLRYNYLLSVTETQQGDFARTADSFANALRTVKAYAQAVSTQIGVGLAAALRHVLILVRTLLKGVLQLATTFANFMQTIFGKYKGGASGMAMDLGAADDYGNDLADSVDDAASGLGDAADNAQKLRKELSVLPFDELNQLNKDQESTSPGGAGGSGGSGTGGGLGDLGDIGDILDLEELIEGSALPDAISKWGERIREAFLDHDWERLGKTIADMLNEGFQFIYDLIDPKKVKEKVEPYITAFGTTFNSLVDELNFDLIGRTIGRGLNDIAMLFNMWYESIDFVNLGAKLAEGLNGILTEANFEEIGTALGNKFMIAWDVFSGFVADKNIWTNVGTAIADGITGLNNAIRLGDIGTTLVNLANGLFAALDVAMSKTPWGDVAKNITNGINNFISKFKWAQNGQIVGRFINNLFNFMQQLLAGQNWGELGAGIATFIANAIESLDFETISSAVDTAMGSVFSFFSQFTENLPFTELGSTLAQGLNIITTNFNKWYEELELEQLGADIAEGVRTLFDDVSFTELGNALGNKFMIGWRIFKGFVSDDKLWPSVGTALANGIKGLTDKISGGEIGSALADLCTGLATTLGTLADDEDMWDGVVTTIRDCIATFLAENKWDQNRENLVKFLKKLCAQLVLLISDIPWENVGKQLAKTLAEIPWDDVKKVAEALLKALGDFVKGLISEPEGAVAVAIVTGLGLLNITSKIASSAIGGMIIKGIAGSIIKHGSDKALGDAVSTVVSNSTGGGSVTGGGIFGNSFGSILLQTGFVIGQLGELRNNFKKTNDFVSGMHAIEDFCNNSALSLETLNRVVELAGEKSNTAGFNIATSMDIARDAIAKAASDGQISSEEATILLTNLRSNLGLTEEEFMAVLQASADSSTGVTTNVDEMSTNVTGKFSQLELMLGAAGFTWMSGLAAGMGIGYTDSVEPEIDHIHQGVGKHFGEIEDDAETTGSNIDSNLANGMGGFTASTQKVDAMEKYLDKSFSASETRSTTFGQVLVRNTANGIGRFEPVQVKINEMGKAFKLYNDSIETVSYKGGQKAVTQWSDGVGRFQQIKDKMTEMASSIHSKYVSIEDDSSKTGKNVDLKVSGGIGNHASITKSVSSIQKEFGDKYSTIQSDATETGKKTVSNMAFGLSDLVKLALNLAAMRLLVTNNFDKVKEEATSTGKQLISNLSSGIASKSYEISATCNEIANSIRKAFDIGLYDYGRSAGQSFANGIGSVSIPLPHVEVGWDTIFLYDGSWFQTPNFSVNWYRAGGLFRGGSGQLIGIAEDGRDEAVLPLENRRTMSMIADSIVSASGNGMGISKDDIVDGVVEALLTAQNNQQNPVFHIEVKTEDDEVLARAVTRGQQSIDYRNNPTPSLA